MTIEKRLKEERQRLGYNQKDFGHIYGVSKATQIEYEKGASFPNAKQLENIAEVGADVLYIITGRKDNFSSDQLDLIKLFDQANLENKLLAVQALKGQLQSGVVQTNTGEHQLITGSGQIINKK